MVSASALGLPTPVGTDPDDVAGYLSAVSTAITLLLGSRGAGTPTVTSAPASPPRTYLDTSTSPWGLWASDGNTWTQVNPVPGISGVTGLQAALQALSNGLTVQATQESSDVNALNGAIASQTTTERSRATAAEALLQPTAGKDANGGYVGRDANGGITVPGDASIGGRVGVIGGYVGLSNGSRLGTDAAGTTYLGNAGNGNSLGINASGKVTAPGNGAFYESDGSTRLFSPSRPDPATAAEVTNRTNADAALQTNINNEATNRQNADGALGSRIDGHESAWTTFVPRVTTDGGDVQPSSNGSMTGRYKVIGKTCHILVALVHGTDGTTGTGGQGSWIIQLPAGLSSRAPAITTFPVRMFSANVTGGHVIGVGFLNSPTSIAVLVTSGFGSSQQVTYVCNTDASNNPALGVPQPGNSNFWWGSGGGRATGELYLSGTFELA
jgi:hypothetical protein